MAVTLRWRGVAALKKDGWDDANANAQSRYHVDVTCLAQCTVNWLNRIPAHGLRGLFTLIADSERGLASVVR